MVTQQTFYYFAECVNSHWHLTHLCSKFLCWFVLMFYYSVNMSICLYVCLFPGPKETRRMNVLGLLELELQMVLSHHVGAGN